MSCKLRTTHLAFPSTVSSVAAVFVPLEGHDCPRKEHLESTLPVYSPPCPEKFSVQFLGYFSWSVSKWTCREWRQTGGRLQSLWALI